MMLLCGAAIVVAVLCTVTEPTAMSQKKPLSVEDYRAISQSNEIVVAGLQKRYKRKDTGCVATVEFYNDPTKCEGNEKCIEYLKKKEEKDKTPVKAKWIFALPILGKDGRPLMPEIWGETLRNAGSTMGESNVCGDWRFTVADSPGWDCDYVAGHEPDRIVCSCIGFYIEPGFFPGYPELDDHCCDPNGCVPRPGSI
jgi:hypothetical protein